ncbi:radical SAM protein [Heliobacterium undosum]|uniref:Radical SAM protein n=1 Tax=Heliomicrobium undosum TaxID=121734 RepID=A0A845L6C0_9FIRM|nr:radical SAM protein [Heliomicrobium undosum]MZP30585.1 radical SAM protein [Heliomicrobium undosum]
MDGRVLLLSVHRLTYDALSLDMEPPGLLILAAFLETKGYDALVCQGEPAGVRAFLAEQAASGPVLAVGFYCDYENQVEVAALGAEVHHNYGWPVILGGPQVGGLDEAYLRQSCALAAVAGEGEVVLWQLLDCLTGQGGDWRSLEGVIYVDETGQLRHNGLAPMIQDLDELPSPAYHRWVNKPFRKKAYVMGGRGCPYNCAFCHEGSLSRTLRVRSVDKVMADVETLLALEPHINYIIFADDTFTVSPQRMTDFCRRIAKLRESRDFVWYCEGHVKLLYRWPDMMQEMAAAGMVRLQVGIESGVQRLLDLYGKKTTLPEIEAVIQAAYEAGVHQMTGFFINGGPFEDPEIVAQNKAFCERLLHLAPGMIELGPSALIPYPETDIARRPDHYGLRILDRRGWTSFGDYPVTETAAMTREAIAKAQRELVEHGIHTMRQLFQAGKIPHQRILDCFKDLRYGVVSVWHKAVYSEAPFVAGYYTLMARDAVRRSADIAPGELPGWRPQRIMEMWLDVDFSQGYPRIGREVLSPLEFELLRHSTGKLTLAQVLDRVYDRFRERFDHREEFDGTAMGLLRGFEKRYWLAYAPF